MDQKQIAEQILELVGGIENVVSLSHCFTRLRFVLKEEAKAAKHSWDQLPAVRGVFSRSGSFQVVIGMEVASYYRILEKMLTS